MLRPDSDGDKLFPVTTATLMQMVVLPLAKVNVLYTSNVPALFLDMNKLPELITTPLPDTIAIDPPKAMTTLPPLIVTSHQVVLHCKGPESNFC